MSTSHTDYREFFKQELARRTAKNPKYSARAFAKSVGTAPSFLSAVLNGKKSLSYIKAVEIADKLQFSEDKKRMFLLSVEAELVHSPRTRKRIRADLAQISIAQQTQPLEQDRFRYIADWFHFPIRELLGLHPSLTASDVAARLGVGIEEATRAIECMRRLELIEYDEISKTYKKSQAFVQVSSETGSTPLKHFHKQMLTKAIESLDRDSAAERAIGSETLAFDEAHLPEVREALDEFLNRVMDIANRSESKTEIFHVNAAMFKLTRPI